MQEILTPPMAVSPLPAGFKRIYFESGKSVLIPTTAGVFADLKYDVPFKLAFGESHAKTRLTGLINSILERLELPLIIGTVSSKDREIGGENLGDKQIRLDSHLVDNSGRRFNVEMQKNATGQYQFIMRRLELYQGRNKGAQSPYPNAIHRYDIPPVMTIMFTDFIMLEQWPMIVHLRNADLSSKTETLDPVNGDKTIIIQLPKFNKKIEELNDDLDVYLFLFKHMGSMLEIPAEFDNEKFRPIFEKLRIKNTNNKDMEQYALSEKMQLTYEYQMKLAAKEAELKGKNEGKIEGEQRAATVINNLVLELLKRSDPTLPSIEEALKLSTDEKERLYNSLTTNQLILQ